MGMNRGSPLFSVINFVTNLCHLLVLLTHVAFFTHVTRVTYLQKLTHDANLCYLLMLLTHVTYLCH